MKIFIDENMPPQLAEGLSILERPNNEGVEVYSIQKEYGRGILDEDWIPKVGSSKGIVITQDFKMQRIQSQYNLLRKYGLGIFYLVPPGGKGYTYWEMVERIILNWQEIKGLAKKNRPPFAFRITPRKIEKIS